MLIIIIISNTIVLIYALFHIIRYYTFLKKIKKRKRKTKKESNLIIVIPCLYEQNTIVETVNYFKKIIYESIPIILVTTKKETKKPTTKDIIKEKILTKYSNIYLLDYSNKNGIMADQLNYVLKNLDKIPYKFNLEKTYFCVYNADSRPNKETFNELYNSIIDNNFPEFIQQYSYALSNYSKLSFILKGFAIYQSDFELKCGLLNSLFDSKILHRHLVGHGLFIRLDILKKINGFNNTFWCEDIYMTGIANNMNYKIQPLLSLENMETPDKLTKLIKQNAVWFGTASKNVTMYKTIFKECNKKTLRGIIGMINELKSAINWLFFPILIITSFITSFIYGAISFIISLIIYSLYIFIYSFTTIKIINNLEKKNYKYNFEVFFSTFVATLLSNIGPLYYIIFNPKEKYKTER